MLSAFAVKKRNKICPKNFFPEHDLSWGRRIAGPELQRQVVVAKVEAGETFRIGVQRHHDGLQPGSLPNPTVILF